MKLFFLLSVVAVSSASFPKEFYYIQNLWGCPGENGETSSYKWKCNQMLKVDSKAYVHLSNKGDKFELCKIGGHANRYAIVYYAGNTKKYLSYNTKLSTWAVVDESDNYMYWEITPRGNGYAIKSKYNCPSWPCNAEITSGDDDEKYLWLEAGYNQNYRLIPAE